jgi:chaperonin GroES
LAKIIISFCLRREDEMSKLIPLHDKVVIRRNPKEVKTSGGIVIPDTAGDNKPNEGEVIAVGPGKHSENGQIIAPSLKVGDKVVFGKYSGTEFKIGDKEHVVLREEDILAVLKD